jgi:hypothetical protein
MSVVTGWSLMCTICYPCVPCVCWSQEKVFTIRMFVFLILGLLCGVSTVVSKNCFKSHFYSDLLEQVCNVSYTRLDVWKLHVYSSIFYCMLFYRDTDFPYVFFQVWVAHRPFVHTFNYINAASLWSDRLCISVSVWVGCWRHIFMSNHSSYVFMFNDESKNAEGRFNLPVILRLIITSSSNNLLIYWHMQTFCYFINN